MKPTRYTSAPKLGRAWLDRRITGTAIAGRTGAFKIIADPNTIWNGDKTQVLVRRHQSLDLVIALRRGSASLGSAAIACINLAVEIPEISRHGYSTSGPTKKVITERVVPVPYTFVDNLQDEDLSSCDLATLQPFVWQSSKSTLDCLIRSYRTLSPDNWRFRGVETQWAREIETLGAVGLTMPKEYEEKKVVAIATRRLRSGVYHK
jgi:hypothetical protein